MSKQMPLEGTHPAKLPEPIVVYVTDAGALCAAVPVELLSEVPWVDKSTVTIVSKDGVPMKNNIKNLRKAFAWESADPFDLESAAVGTEFDAVGGLEDYDPENTGSPVKIWKVKWINPKGASAKMPDKVALADRKAILTKFGGKLKAMLAATGGKVETKPAVKAAPAAQAEIPLTPKPATAAAPAKVPPRAAAGGPPSRKPAAAPAVVAPAVSSQEEVWTRFEAASANSGKSPDELGTLFWSITDKIKPGSDGSDLTPEEWGKVAEELGV